MRGFIGPLLAVCLGVSCLLRVHAALGDPTDPGLILSVGGEARPFSFAIPATTAYLLEFPAQIAVFIAPGEDEVLPGQVLFAPNSPGDGDGDGDMDLRDIAILQTCFGASGGHLCSPFDLDGDGALDVDDYVAMTLWFSGPLVLTGDLCHDGVVDIQDWETLEPCLAGPVLAAGCGDLDGDTRSDLRDWAVFQRAFGSRLAPEVQVTLYATGTAASEVLGDKLIEVWSGGDLVHSQAATAVELGIQTPTQVRLGSEIILTVQPSGGPVVFGAGSMVTFETPSATVEYGVDDLHIVSPCQAVVLAGLGDVMCELGLHVSPPVLLSGTVTARLADGTVLDVPAEIVPAAPESALREVVYDEDEGTPALGNPSIEVSVAFDDGGTVPPESDVVLATASHYAVAVAVENNAYTTAIESLQVVLESIDSNGAIVVDSMAMPLYPVNASASPIIFASDVMVPVVPFDIPVDRVALGYTQVFPFEVIDDGYIIVGPPEVKP
jgi:hypothetical protein